MVLSKIGESMRLHYLFGDQLPHPLQNPEPKPKKDHKHHGWHLWHLGRSLGLRHRIRRMAGLEPLRLLENVDLGLEALAQG
jgi:hypothetical protein